MEREATQLVEQLIESYGPRALNPPREDVAELLEDRGLDHDREAVDAFFRHMRWLWEE